MPTFSTPEPISATIELIVGDVRVTASERTDTVVEVRPSDRSREPDVRAAQQTRVEYAAGRLSVTVPKSRTLGLGRVGSVDLRIELPVGSEIHAVASLAAFHSVGRLGVCRVKIASGNIRLDQTAALDLSTGMGTIGVEHAAGHADINTGSGKVRLLGIDGSAVIKNSNGDSWIGTITGDVKVNAANGDILIDRAGADVDAKTANGDVRIGEVVRGAASLRTACGEIEVGITAGTAARVDAHTSFGRVRNGLEATGGPGATDEKVEVQARTSAGDIIIRRSRVLT